MNNPTVLIFDSGVGGLSVATEIRKLLPDLRLVYAADTAWMPYGNKSKSALREHLPGLVWALCEMTRADLVVIACNTASTMALADIRDALPVPVVGVVPAIKPAAEGSKSGTIGLLGTPGTVTGAYTDELIRKYAGDKTIIRCGSVALVEETERIMRGAEPDQGLLIRELSPLFDRQNAGSPLDTIVLACTHFPLIQSVMEGAISREDVLSQNVKWIDSGSAVARRVRDLLRNVQSLPAKRRKGKEQCEGGLAFFTANADLELLVPLLKKYGFPRSICLMEA